MIALSSVVIDDIQHDLEIGVMKSPNHGLKILDRVAVSVGLMRTKVAERAVAPVVFEFSLDQKAVIHKSLHR